MFYWESHLGGVYATPCDQDDNALRCRHCGETDWSIGEFDAPSEFLAAFADEIDIDGSGGYALSYVLGSIECDLTATEAAEIVRRNKTMTTNEDSHLFKDGAQ